MTKSEALDKMMRFCAYRERCHYEVRAKLLELKVYGDLLEQVMSELINEDYLNEERYTRSYVRGKYRMNNWGRNKIVQALKMRHVSEYCIRQGLKEIVEEEYLQNLYQILDKYRKTKKALGPIPLRKKLFQYGMSRGYEINELNPILDKILGEHK
jgi:regulatory protein